MAIETSLMINTQKAIFLLGGHDLEMLTIKRLLTSYGYRVLDYNLTWGACLSSYATIFESADPSLSIFGIELKDDLGLYDLRYRPIDHHNELSSLPSSLEQIASLIGHKLSRVEELVAANDKGYIPAMKSLGAADEQIRIIRLLDRKAQGITEEDEILAEQSISHNLKRIGSETLIIYALTTHFSAICDRLFPYKRLLIYTPYEWAFYGDGKSSISKEMAKEISLGRIFCGGGDNGYIGTVKGAFTSDQINTFVSCIIDRYEHI